LRWAGGGSHAILEREKNRKEKERERERERGGGTSPFWAEQ